MAKRAIPLLMLAGAALYGASDPTSAPNQNLEQTVGRLSEQVRALTAEVTQLRGQLDLVRLESANTRVARLREELRQIAAARRALEARETERARELAETDEYLADSAPKGTQRDLAEVMRQELAVTRPVELAGEQAKLDAREANVRTRLEAEERALAALRAATTVSQ